MLRAAAYTVLSTVLLTLYGTQVCPFLDSLPLWKLALTMGVALLVMLVTRPLWLRLWVFPSTVDQKVGKQARVDLGGFVLVGLGLTVFDLVVYEFPVQSGLKVMVGCVMLGVFYSLDLALETERSLVEEASRTGQRLTAGFQLRSLTRSFAMVAIAVLGLLGAVFFLVISKDLAWIITIPAEGIKQAQRSILVEVVFVVGVMMLLAINLAVSYSRNLKVFFEFQTDVLHKVARGHLDSYVPISGANEFALIARHTNEMIDELREKQRIENLFGKVVSPEIARRLLAPGADGFKLGGTRRNLVILFSDIRNFTSFSETQTPEAVVKLLNAYFAVMVRIIRQHGGLVDKFIGDGMLAVFGLDNPTDASSRAVQAAVAMLTAARELTRQLNAPVEIGIGIHRGEVVAGNVGSPERLEFTFIGDAVNTASRLESVTKQLKSPIVVSSAIKEDLNAQVQALPWVALGEQQLKGKATAVALFGLQAQAAATT
jgi:adenylate cyclase